MTEVTRSQFYEVFKKYSMKTFSSFSDPAGTSPIGYGRPAMNTEWGIVGTEESIARLEMRKDYEYQEEWRFTYYLHEDYIEGD